MVFILANANIRFFELQTIFMSCIAILKFI
jgi:hypothetical protein